MEVDSWTDITESSRERTGCGVLMNYNRRLCTDWSVSLITFKSTGLRCKRIWVFLWLPLQIEVCWEVSENAENFAEEWNELCSRICELEQDSVHITTAQQEQSITFIRRIFKDLRYSNTGTRILYSVWCDTNMLLKTITRQQCIQWTTNVEDWYPVEWHQY